ncbi:MAG: hypothetical protein KDJ66_02735, partial [Nitratireductor sp.]|nr:hypothetical protein [Nitratireductor sp.]
RYPVYPVWQYLHVVSVRHWWQLDSLGFGFYLPRHSRISIGIPADRFGNWRFFGHKISQTRQLPALIRHLAILQL